MKITKLLAGGVVLLALFSCSTSVEETVEKQETPEIAEIPEVPKTYTISIAESLNGSVAANLASAEKGSLVTITVSAESGYGLKKIEAKKSDGIFVALAASTQKDSYTFSMPAADVTVYAEYIPVVSASLSNLSEVITSLTTESMITLTGEVTAEDLATIKSFINDSSFDVCLDLTSVTGLESVPFSSFGFCKKLSGIYLPDSVTSIGNYAFVGCDGIASFFIPNTVSSIGKIAFYGCEGLTSVNIPSGIISIDEDTFAHCKQLTSVVIPDSVTSIEGGAFSFCKGLTSVAIPNSVTNIDGTAFSGCDKLTEIILEPGNTNFTFINGVLFNFDKTQLVYYPSGKRESSFSIPNCVTTIGNGAFSGCDKLTSICIPDSVTSINDYAFCGCDGLTSIVIPKSVESIGNGAFCECENLSSINIPKGVTSIGQASFGDCYKLTTITFSDTSTWYRTMDKSKWQSKTEGTETDMTDETVNASNFKGDYWPYYWYKL